MGRLRPIRGDGMPKVERRTPGVWIGETEMERSAQDVAIAAAKLAKALRDGLADGGIPAFGREEFELLAIVVEDIANGRSADAASMPD